MKDTSSAANAVIAQKAEFENYFKNQMNAQAARLSSQFEARFAEAMLTKEEDNLLNMDGA